MTSSSKRRIMSMRSSSAAASSFVGIRTGLFPRPLGLAAAGA
jgi:hypothetical protein